MAPAMPDNTMNLNGRDPIVPTRCNLPRDSDTIKRKTNIIKDLTVVAIVESRFFMPILPNIATRAAKTAESNAKINHMLVLSYHKTVLKPSHCQVWLPALLSQQYSRNLTIKQRKPTHEPSKARKT